MDQVIPYYKIEDENKDWIAWKRDQLVVELEFYAREVAEEEFGDMETPENVPMCENCGIYMIKRRNRATQEEFWGCLRFPDCKETLALEYAGQEAAKVQKARMVKQAEMVKRVHKEKGYRKQLDHGQLGGESGFQEKVSLLDGEEMDGNVTKRCVRKPESDFSSTWDVMSMGSEQAPTKRLVAITKEEMAALKEMREQSGK